MKKEHGTQKERLLQYLQERKTIDPLQAWFRLGIYALAPRVYDLRKDGWNISTEVKEVKNKFGEICRVAEYHFQKDIRIEDNDILQELKQPDMFNLDFFNI